jgi:hypothetical protein
VSQEPVSITERPVVWEIPGMAEVSVERDVVYQAGEGGESPLTLDLYRPAEAAHGARLPVVILVAGFPGQGVERRMGCKFKHMGSSVSWGRLIAASGMVAIAYDNRSPAADLVTLLAALRRHAEPWGLDEQRIGLWASSGNVPLALWLLMEAAPLRCAALLYGFTLDAAGMTAVAESARAWGFANPAAGRTVADLPAGLPLFIARAGHDEIPGLNETLDRFVAGTLASNLPLSLVNHPAAPQAFDLLLKSEGTRAVILAILAFLRFHLVS